MRPPPALSGRINNRPHRAPIPLYASQELPSRLTHYKKRRAKEKRREAEARGVSCNQFGCRLEQELQSQLNNAGIESTLHFAEVGVVIVQSDAVELGMVKRVERFEPELYPRAFLFGEEELFK
jgi:hypothetical protein